MKCKSVLLLLLTLSAATADELRITEPVRVLVENPAELEQQLTLQASSLPDQWVAAYTKLRQSSSNEIQIVLIKDGQTLTLDNIYKIEKSPDYRTSTGVQSGGLLVAHQRQGNRDYRIIIDPRQIRYIREIDS